jgi:hypothetical protein
MPLASDHASDHGGVAVALALAVAACLFVHSFLVWLIVAIMMLLIVAS